MRSDNVTKGAERAPNRSLFYALGYTPEDLEKPLIAVVSAHSDIVPGHMNLDKLTDAVKSGIEAAGGTPFMVPAIGVCDGIAMGHVGMKYSLASRELICDSVETMFMAHQFDGCVLVPNCDKIVPGMVMAAVRMNVPAVVCSGGPMLAGTYDGQEVSLSKMFEAVGSYKAGMISAEQLEDCTQNCCPGCGSCSGMYTANSMNCLCEAVGIALPGNGTIPAVYGKRLQLGRRAGAAIMEMVRRNICARDIINARSIRNALTCDMALGCSTNTVLHLLAIAQEAGCPVDLALFNEISEKTPNLCHLAPAGPTHMPDLYAAGGIPAVQAELAKRGLLDLDCLTVTGKTVGENIQGVQNLNHKAIRPIDEPFSPTGGLQILWGNIAPHGCVVKRSAVAPEMLTHTGPARVFDSEDDAIAAIYGGKIVPGDVVVIRYEGPKGGANTRALLAGMPANNVLLYGDAGTGRSSTVKAIANEFAADGLRLVEVKKNQLYQIPDLMDKLAANPLKFILFIDDLSFTANDDNFAALKAILEGSVGGRARNIAVYATSNRRHLIKETLSDRTGRHPRGRHPSGADEPFGPLRPHRHLPAARESPLRGHPHRAGQTARHRDAPRRAADQGRSLRHPCRRPQPPRRQAVHRAPPTWTPPMEGGLWAAEQVGEGAKAVIIYGQEGDNTSNMRREGYQKACDEAGVTVLDALSGQNTTDGATKTMEDLLNSHPGQIDIVLCHNDDTAIGAMNACKSAGVD